MAIIFLTSRIIFVFFAAISPLYLPLKEGYLGRELGANLPYLVWVWANFDGRHFYKIASLGYTRFNFVYFPLYPFFMFIIKKILPLSLVYIGLIISLTAFFIALYFLYKLVRLDYKKPVALLTLWTIAFFPTSYYYQSVYSESVFLLFSVISFYFAKKRSWLKSGFFAGFVTASHFSGITILPALAVEWFCQKPKKLKNLLNLFLGVWGIAAYIIFQKMRYGSFLLFIRSFSAWNREKLTFPPQVFYRYLKIFYLVDKRELVFWIAVLEFLTVISFLGLSFYLWKTKKYSYSIFIILLLAMGATSGSFIGSPRYTLHLFPAFIAISQILSKNKLLTFVYLIFSLALGFILTALFTRGYFVA